MVVTGQANKFMAYEELIKQDIKIGFLGFGSKSEEDAAWHGGYPPKYVPDLYHYRFKDHYRDKELQAINAILNERLIEKGGRANLSVEEIELVAQNLIREHKRQQPKKPPCKINPELEIEWDISWGLSKKSIDAAAH